MGGERSVSEALKPSHHSHLEKPRRTMPARTMKSSWDDEAGLFDCLRDHSIDNVR
jgi:hypothetical protein